MNVVEVLSNISGIDRKQVKSIFEEVLANNKLINGCPGPHIFTIAAGRRKIADDSICEVCGGRISSSDKSWYEKGLAHGRGEMKGKIMAILAEFGEDPETALACIGELVSDAREQIF